MLHVTRGVCEIVRVRVAFVALVSPVTPGPVIAGGQDGEYRKMWNPTEPRDWAQQYRRQHIPFSKSNCTPPLIQVPPVPGPRAWGLRIPAGLAVQPFKL